MVSRIIEIDKRLEEIRKELLSYVDKIENLAIELNSANLDDIEVYHKKMDFINSQSAILEKVEALSNEQLKLQIEKENLDKQLSRFS